MKKNNIIWGLVLILCGVLLILGKLGYLGQVNGFSLAATIFLVVVMIRSIVHLEFGGVLFPLAFIGILYDQELKITAITPWTILLAALLGTVGLHMIFDRYRKGSHHHIKYEKLDGGKYNVVDTDRDSDSYVKVNSHFGGVSKYINSDDFKRVDIHCTFGGAEVYLDNAIITENTAVVNVECYFGGVELYIPKEWKIDNQINATLSGVTENNRNTGTSDKTLILQGNLSCAGVDITYI